MENRILRKLFLGFIQVHILYHASKVPVYGVYMIEELKRHGYKVSAGTIYPILHHMVDEGLLSVEKKVVNGKVRKYSTITPEGAARRDPQAWPLQAAVRSNRHFFRRRKTAPGPGQGHIDGP